MIVLEKTSGIVLFPNQSNYPCQYKVRSGFYRHCFLIGCFNARNRELSAVTEWFSRLI